VIVSRRRHPLHPSVRRSPYFPETERAGAIEYMVYNHMYMPIDYGRAPIEDYRALVERAVLWDVGAERQTELRGTDSLRLADFLCARDLSELEVGRCRYTMVCDENGRIMTECVVLRWEEDTVWISHGDVDLTLWARAVAVYGGYRVTVSEPDVAPLQIQGPRSPAVIEAVAGIEAAGLTPYSSARVRVAETDVVVSRTGWSGEVGYELYPIGSERALDIWKSVLSAGDALGLFVTGPNLVRACERGITDTHYFVNSDMTPFEAGAGWAVDLDTAPFIGRDALLAAREQPRARHTVGLVAAEDLPVPRLESFWPVLDDAGKAGEARWVVRSIALARPIAIALVDARVEVGDAVRIVNPEGEFRAAVVELPFVREATPPSG
jgi:glycine cleavage system aminomethyltransferase T